MADNFPLADQKLAVSMFLDSLMREPEDSAPQAGTALLERPVIASPVLTPADIVVDLAPAARDVTVDEAPPTAAVAPVEAEATPEVVAPEVTTAATSPEIAGGRPDWANVPFQAMLFKVAGLSLAVPLVELNGVVEWSDDVTEMPGHAPFYMGLMTHLERSIPVIDTARLVLPAEKMAQLAGDDPRARVKRVVLIDEHRWGLACDEVNEVITLQPEQVRWRSSRTKRSWLAGTVVDHMCALIDGVAFSAMLKDGSHQRK